MQPSRWRLSSLDRLELRGSDSVGLHVLVTGHALDFDDPRIAAAIARRSSDPLFMSTAVRTPAGHLSIVYKHAAEIGGLGDNGRALRATISADSLLFEALQSSTAHVVVLGPHPLGQYRDDQPSERASTDERGTLRPVAPSTSLRRRRTQRRRRQLCGTRSIGTASGSRPKSPPTQR